MNNALVKYEQLNLNDLGNIMVKSGFFADTRDAAQAMVKIMAGAELGFGPIASMQGVNIIKGKTSLSANLVGAAIKRSGRYDYRIVKLDDSACELAFYEGGKQVGVSTFSRKDAEIAGLSNGDNYRKFPRNMLFSRALTNGARWYCPDVFNGPIYTPDELGEQVDGETGEVVEGQISEPGQLPEQEIYHPSTPKPETIDYSQIHEAIRTMTNSKGTLYIDIPTEQLSHMVNALEKALRNNGLSDDEKAEKSDKLAAAKAILDYRRSELDYQSDRYTS